jgi:DNA-binding MarR family transcriptional regulator
MNKSEIDAHRLMQDFYQVVRSRHALFQDMLSSYGVTLHQFHLLLYMKASGKVTVSDLGNKMLVSMPTASRMLNTLCEKGLASKNRDENDRRLIYLELTPKGKHVVDEADARQREVLSRVLEKIPAAEADAFLHTMEKVAEGLTSLLKEETR